MQGERNDEISEKTVCRQKRVGGYPGGTTSQKTPCVLACAVGQDVFTSQDVDPWSSVAWEKDISIMNCGMLCVKVLSSHANRGARCAVGYLGLDFRARCTLEI